MIKRSFLLDSYTQSSKNLTDQGLISFFHPPRIKWLQQGSRGLFGNVFEDDVYILIDTSQSMKDKLPLVKEKIVQLIQVCQSDVSED